MSPQWNKFEMNDRDKAIDYKVNEVLLEFETQAEFKFDTEIAPTIPACEAIPEWLMLGMKKLYVTGFMQGVAKALEAVKMNKI